MTLALPFTRKADGTESKAVPAAVQLCSEHLKKFTEDPDQNLKYLVSFFCPRERGEVVDAVDAGELSVLLDVVVVVVVVER